jgi:hypothetical protein
MSCGWAHCSPGSCVQKLAVGNKNIRHPAQTTKTLAHCLHDPCLILPSNVMISLPRAMHRRVRTNPLFWDITVWQFDIFSYAIAVLTEMPASSTDCTVD